jgi:hypothetical protein
MAKFYGAIALTGGGTGSLDAIPSTNLVQGDGCIVITSSGEAMFYRLSSAGGQTEAAPNIVLCDDDTAKSWHIIKLVSSNIDALGVINSSGLITAGAGLTVSSGKLTASSGALITGNATFDNDVKITGTLTATNSCSNVARWAGAAKTVSTATASGGAAGDIWFHVAS